MEDDDDLAFRLLGGDLAYWLTLLNVDGLDLLVWFLSFVGEVFRCKKGLFGTEDPLGGCCCCCAGPFSSNEYPPFDLEIRWDTKLLELPSRL